MARPVPAVPTVYTGQAITAAIWNRFAYANSFHTAAPSALLRQTVAQVVPSTTETVINFDAAARDADAGHNTAANSSRYTVQVRGLYQVTVGASLQGGNSGGGERSVAIKVNGGDIWAIYLLAPTGTTAEPFIGGCEFDIPLNVGDFVESQLWQDSGADLNTQVGTQLESFMAVRWVAA